MKMKTPRKPRAPKTDVIEAEGVVVENLPGARFRVQPDGMDHTVICSPNGKMRMHYIRVIPGDRVRIEISVHNPQIGRVTYRMR